MTNNYFKVIARRGDLKGYAEYFFFDGASMVSTMEAMNKAKECRNAIACGLSPRMTRVTMFRDPRVRGEWSELTLVGWTSREEMLQAMREGRREARAEREAA